MINKLYTAINILRLNGLTELINYIFVKLKIPFHLNSVQKSDVLDFLKKCKIYNVEHKLIRIGPLGDGGYLVPDILDQIQYCYSPGMGESTSFEDMLLSDYKIQSFTADGSIKNVTSKHQFLSKNIGLENNEKYITLDTWIENNTKNNNNLLLQMDVEGHELEILLSKKKRKV